MGPQLLQINTPMCSACAEEQSGHDARCAMLLVGHSTMGDSAWHDPHPVPKGVYIFEQGLWCKRDEAAHRVLAAFGVRRARCGGVGGRVHKVKFLRMALATCSLWSGVVKQGVGLSV